MSEPRQHLWALKRRRWSILSFVFASVLATLVVSSRITPEFEATATVDIDRRMPAGVLGQEAMLSAANDADPFLATQMRLIQSDAVLRPVAQRYKLLDAEEAYARGTVKPVDADDAPVLLTRLRVTRPPKTYLLLIAYRSPDRRLAADVANAVAQSYLEHTYNIRYRSSASLAAFMELQLEELKARMERSNAALAQFEREPEVIHPEGKSSLLSARLLKLNTEYLYAQTDRAHQEAAYNSVRGGAPEASGVETEYRKSAAREAKLKKAVGETKMEFERLNTRSFEYQALKREAAADKKLHEELVRAIKEAGINAGIRSNSIRIADPARPALQPVFPNLKLNLLLAFFCSALLAMGAAAVSGALDNTVKDPEQVARALKTEVIGNLPVVKSWRGKLAHISVGANGEQALSSYQEAIRTLRNSILLVDFDRNLHSLLVTSALPGEGKSTIAAHLAVAHARQGHRTLLIDADLRRPSVHRRFAVPGTVGLATTLVAESPWRDAVLKLEQLPELEILAAGPNSRRAADLIGMGLSTILEEAAATYDLVILDAPPMLGSAEPLQLATVVDGVVVVARAGQTSRKAVASVLGTLQRLRANLVGLVLNDMTGQFSDGYKYYGYPSE